MNTALMQSTLPAIAMVFYAIQPKRSAVALLLFGAAMLHFYMFSDTESDVLYYVSACTFDVAVALVLASIGCRVSADLAMLSIASAALNLFGLLMWFAYMPANVYNACIQIILGLQILRLLWVQGDDMARDTRFRGWGGVVHRHNLRGGGAGKGEAA